MADFYLVVDTGGSQTKIIFQLPGQNKPQFLLMDPRLEPISEEALQRYHEQRGWLGAPAPIQQAWIKVKDSLWAVGAFAAEFDPVDRLREKKYENALYKVLAAIGVLAMRAEFEGKRKFSIFLGVLLPWAEFGDRKRFEAQIQAMLSAFWFQSHKLSVKLERFVCQPEGGGLAATYLRQKGAEWFQSERLAVLVFGHRNTSMLAFEQGQLVKGSSPLYGFSLFLDAVAELFGSIDPGALTHAIAKGVEERRRELSDRMALALQIRTVSWQAVPEIEALVTARLPELKARELDDLCEAIYQAQAIYWEKIRKWLDGELPRQCDLVIVSGGAARFVEVELEIYLAQAAGVTHAMAGRFRDMLWDGGLGETLRPLFQLTTGEEQVLLSRLADAYGLFDYLVSLAGVKA